MSNVDQAEWRAAVGFEGFYEVSSDGRVRSVARVDMRGHRVGGKIKKQFLSEGYAKVSISVDGREVTKSVHRLVATAFVENPRNAPQVNHKNGVKSDNRTSNLEWVTIAENVQHSFDSLGRLGSGLGKFGASHHSSKPVVATHLETGEVRIYAAAMEAGRAIGTRGGTVSLICNGLRKQSRGWSFRHARHDEVARLSA